MNCRRANFFWLLFGGIFASSGTSHPNHADGDLVATFLENTVVAKQPRQTLDCPWLKDVFPFRYDGKHLTHVDGKQFVFAAGGVRIFDGDELFHRGGWGGSRGIYSRPHVVVLEGEKILPKSILESIRKNGGWSWDAISDMPPGSKLRLSCAMAVEGDRENTFHVAFTFSKAELGID